MAPWGWNVGRNQLGECPVLSGVAEMTLVSDWQLGRPGTGMASCT